MLHITSANKNVLLYIQNKIFNEYNIISHIYSEFETKNRIVFCGSNAKKLLDLLYYEDNVQKLDRKYKKYLLLK